MKDMAVKPGSKRQKSIMHVIFGVVGFFLVVVLFVSAMCNSSIGLDSTDLAKIALGVAIGAVAIMLLD